MKIRALLLIFVGTLFTSQVACQIQTPPIDSPLRPGSDVTVASIKEPEVGDGSTPDGVKADQVFQAIPDNSNPDPIQAGVDNNEPVLSGRKMLSGRTMLVADLSLTGDGTQVGADGAGVTSTQAGHGQTGLANGQPEDTHIEPHTDETTATAAGKSVSTGVAVNPDNLAGEGPPVVYTNPGRK